MSHLRFQTLTSNEGKVVSNNISAEAIATAQFAKDVWSFMSSAGMAMGVPYSKGVIAASSYAFMRGYTEIQQDHGDAAAREFLIEYLKFLSEVMFDQNEVGIQFKVFTKDE